MGARWLSDLLGTKKTSFTIGKGTISTSPVSTPDTLLRMGNGVLIMGKSPASTDSGDSWVISGSFAGGTSGNSGPLVLKTAGTTDGVTGTLTITTSDASGTDRSSGDLSITPGKATGSAVAGTLTLSGGAGGTTSAGSIISIITGVGGTTSGASGALTLGSGTVTDGNTGAVTLKSGNATGTNRNTGDVVLQTGTKTGTGTAGTIRLKHATVTVAQTTTTGLKAQTFQDTQQTITFGATPSVDVSLGSIIDLTLTGNVTGLTFTGGVDGQKILCRFRQDGTGSRTFAFGSGVRFSADIPSYTITATASKLDMVAVIYNATDSKYDVTAINKGY